MSEECDYKRGVGTCTQTWRNCAFYGEPKCITDEPLGQPRDARGQFVTARPVAGSGTGEQG